MKVEHRGRNHQIDKIKLEEVKPSLKKEFNQAFGHLDVYDRGQIWNKYLETERRGPAKLGSRTIALRK